MSLLFLVISCARVSCARCGSGETIGGGATEGGHGNGSRPIEAEGSGEAKAAATADGAIG